MMTDVLVPIGAHLFSAAALQQYAAAAALEIAPGKTGILKGGVDADGVKVVLVLTVDVKAAVVKVMTAYAHDVTGDDRFAFGASVSF